MIPDSLGNYYRLAWITWATKDEKNPCGTVISVGTEGSQ